MMEAEAAGAAAAEAGIMLPAEGGISQEPKAWDQYYNIILGLELLSPKNPRNAVKARRSPTPRLFRNEIHNRGVALAIGNSAESNP